MDQAWIRNTVIGCAFASCAMVAGPGVAGVAVAHAGLLGIGPDFGLLDHLFGHRDRKKSDQHHPRPGTDTGLQAERSTTSLAAAEVAAPTAKFGSQPEAVAIPGVRSGNDWARAAVAPRAANLPRVSTKPSTRTVVIRAPQATQSPISTTRPPFVALQLPPPPAAVPLAAPPPIPPTPAQSPQVNGPLAPSHSTAGRAPDSFRVGYDEYLRTASTTDLFVAAIPGVAGIAGFTLVGAYAGYRQARAVQRALLAPVPTSILL